LLLQRHTLRDAKATLSWQRRRAAIVTEIEQTSRRLWMRSGFTSQAVREFLFSRVPVEKSNERHSRCLQLARVSDFPFVNRASLRDFHGGHHRRVSPRPYRQSKLFARQRLFQPAI